MIIGIDPGQRGAVAAVDDGAVTVFPMVSTFDFASWIKVNQRKIKHVFVEKSQPMPKQGVSSVFTYGRHFGELLGVLVAYLIPHTLVPPKTWTRVMHVGTKEGAAKERSLEAATRLFPGLSLVPSGCRKPHDGLIDALLICEYGRRSLRA